MTYHQSKIVGCGVGSLIGERVTYRNELPLRESAIMKRIDFHIHTIATVSDQDFAFDQSVLVDYVSELSLDAIAITNHNQFDKQQYESICGNLSIPVFPGIEIDIEKGHLLVITSYEDIADFAARCERVSALVSSATDYLSASQFKEIFPSVDKYILIPHYEKSPTLLLDKVPLLTQFITCGEVNSIRNLKAVKKQKINSPLYSLAILG